VILRENIAMKYYSGDPWHADEDESTVRFHRGDYQAFKAAKRDTPYAEYWPGPLTIRWMLDALNAREHTHPLGHTVND
jgi:hypothetical protein